jgi:hypothetical protein
MQQQQQQQNTFVEELLLSVKLLLHCDHPPHISFATQHVATLLLLGFSTLQLCRCIRLLMYTY